MIKTATCFILLCLTRLVSAGESKPESRLADIREAPDFSLTTQAGDALSLKDQKGKVLLVSFIFTTCNGTCPATTHRMTQIEQELKSRALFKEAKVKLLSITLDPARDTPEALEAYMKLYDIDSAHWSFLTGSEEKVKKAFTAWGMWVKPTTGGQLDHPSRIFLVDRQGRIREIYNLDYLKPKWVADDVNLLLQEKNRQEN